MTLDERIEALVQSVELLSHMVQDRDAMLAKHDENWEKLNKLMQPILTAMPGFMALVVDHDNRIKKLEGDSNA